MYRVLFILAIIFSFLGCANKSVIQDEKKYEFVETQTIDVPGGVITSSAIRQVIPYLDRFKGCWWGAKTATEKHQISLSIYRLRSDANFYDMFRLLKADFDSVSLTPAEIVQFCREYKGWADTAQVASIVFPINENNNISFSEENGYEVLMVSFQKNALSGEPWNIDDPTVFKGSDKILFVTLNKRF